jgi:hypothetical protein
MGKAVSERFYSGHGYNREYVAMPKKLQLWEQIGKAEHCHMLAYEDLMTTREALDEALSHLGQHDPANPLFATLMRAYERAQSAQAHIRQANVPNEILRHMPATLLKEGGEQ